MVTLKQKELSKIGTSTYYTMRFKTLLRLKLNIDDKVRVIFKDSGESYYTRLVRNGGCAGFIIPSLMKETRAFKDYTPILDIDKDSMTFTFLKADDKGLRE